jgi:ribose 1,5-bisphosphokinase
MAHRSARRLMPARPSDALPIGPGRLVVVVGPSGAGKDTLLGLARDDFLDDPNVVFPRRLVTRAPSRFEENQTVSEATFAKSVAAGRFAFWWDAHGLKYALDAAVDDDIRAGKTVICNVSRAVVVELRSRYADVRVVLVTAPPDVLAERLAARRRATDGDVGSRLGRAAPTDRDIAPDIVIENIGDPEIGTARLVAAIDGRRV